MAVVRQTVLVRHHAHHFVAADFSLERAPDATVAAGRDYRAVGASLCEQRFLHQGVGRAGLHAGAARHAFGIDVMLVLPRHHLRIEAAALDRQREGALGFVARAHASRAYDAARGIEGEVRVTIVDRHITVVADAVAVT